MTLMDNEQITLTVKELYVDGVQLPTPKVEGVTITPNKIWSANTGRLESSGLMAGTIVAIKHKIEIKWPSLSMTEVQKIEAAVSTLTPFHTLKYTDMAGQTKEITVYFGDPSYTIYSYSPGVQWINDVSVSAIER